MKKQKRQSVLFRFYDGMAQMVYNLRENTLLGLNDKLDRKAAQYYKE